MSAGIVKQLEAELENVETQIAVLELRRESIHKLLASYTGQTASISSNGFQEIPTIQMARKVLEEHGVPMATADIRREIRRKFNVVPAPSLQQMLYMRATNNKIFFNENKKYGLLVWKARK